MIRQSARKTGRLLLAGFAITVAIANAAAAQSRALFSDSGHSSASAAINTPDPAVVRSRRASADVSLLAQSSRASAGADGFGAAHLAARSVDLNLFTDVDLVAQLERVELVAPLGYAWVGQVAGVADSEVVLAVSDGVLTGSITVPGRTFSVRQVGGLYEIAEINTRLIPGDEPVLPPAAMAGASARGVASAGTDSGDFLDLLMVYTTTVKRAAGGAAAINSIVTASVAQVNSLYAASGIATRVRLVGLLETAYVDSGSTATDLIALQTDGAVRAARDAYGADIVSMLVGSDPASSGRGYVSVSKGQSFSELAYSVTVYYSYLGYIHSLAHEIGHNQGSLHEPGSNGGDDTGGAYPYSLGYTDANHGFYDVMSYGRGCNNCTRLLQFSSPVSTYRGSPVGNPSQDAVRSINNTRTILANYRSAGTGTLNPPTGLTAHVAGSSVSLTWVAPAGTIVTSYLIEVGSASGLSNVASISTGNASTSLASSGIDRGTYYVRVKAVSAAGTSGASSETTIVVGGGGCAAAPQAPTGFGVSSNASGTVTLVWTPSAGASTYVIETGTTPGSSNLVSGADLGGATPAYTASGIAAGTYYVRLRARNTCGTSGVSNEVTLVVR